MTEVPIEVGYRSYIKLMRKKWEMAYHGKDIFFSHANKILEPYYDMNTKEFYGIETNPTRLAIVKFLDQFREGAGVYSPDNFKDLLKYSKTYEKRIRVQKPYHSGLHQTSHSSLLDTYRDQHYQHQSVQPLAQEILPRKQPYQTTLRVLNHPYSKMEGRIWTYIFVPSPPDYATVLRGTRDDGYRKWFLEACQDAHDMIIVEPLMVHFYVRLMLRIFYWSKFGVKLLYAFSLFRCCRLPQLWKWNWRFFTLVTGIHYGLAVILDTNPLAKYKMPDRSHDTECLNQLKYFREFLPSIVHRVCVVFKDVEGEVDGPMRTIKYFHLVNVFLLCYNYFIGSDHWFSFRS